MAGLKRVLAEPARVDPRGFVDGRSGKPRRVPPKMRELIKLLLTGKCTTLEAASERVELNRQYVSRVLRQPHVRAYLDDQVRSELDGAGKVLAGGRLIELLRSPSEHVSLKASETVLGIGGIAPPADGRISININNNIQPGYVIDLTPQGTVIDHDE